MELQKLSTGADSTLGNYRKLSLIVFGPDSDAVRFLDKEIAKYGESEPVIPEESQMVYLLTQMHLKKCPPI